MQTKPLHLFFDDPMTACMTLHCAISVMETTSLKDLFISFHKKVVLFGLNTEITEIQYSVVMSYFALYSNINMSMYEWNSPTKLNFNQVQLLIKGELPDELKTINTQTPTDGQMVCTGSPGFNSKLSPQAVFTLSM